MHTNRLLTCDLNTIALVNQDATITRYCWTREQEVLTTKFKSCVTNPMSSFALKSRDTVGDKNLTISISHIRVPQVNFQVGIKCTLLETDGTTQLSTSNTLYYTLPPTPTQWLTNQLNLFAMYPIAGTPTTMILTVFMRSFDILPQHSLYIYFPSYYSPTLGYHTKYCTVFGLELSCTMYDRYILKLTEFPQTLAKLTTIYIYIYGVVFPKVPQPTNEYFYVAYDQDSNPTSVIQSGTIPTITNLIYPPAIPATFSMNLPITNVLTPFTINIDTAFLTTLAVTAGSTIVIDFPEMYTDIVDNNGVPQFSLTNLKSSKTINGTISQIGGRYNLKIANNFET
jgi:hypothetical protein